MKRNILRLAFALLVIIASMPSWAETSPKHEHRAAWVTTAWRMCWPTSYGTGTTIANKQKAEADAILDIMQENGFNAVYFQVRGMSDAMYKSSYEPWSSYVSGSRGTAPSYDPLEYWVQECHKRGMACYAWVNPYRYESAEGTWGNADYRKNNSSWLLAYDGAVILNPGIKEVRKRIVDVCKEIVTNYDIDGLVFDDYFYLNSIPNSYDSSLYKSSGSSLSQADWRRENVNTMVREVYNMVQSVKPYVRFGISPAGVSKTSASKYGISTSLISSASDWQYSQIYSDPLAWLAEGTVDFISPQIYWLMSHSTNGFGNLSKWWSDACANHFGRHFYASHSISFLNGANTTSNWQEIATQIQCNRDYTGNNAAGCVLFGSRDFTGVRNAGLAPYLKANKFQNLALQPAITWKGATDPGPVSNMALSGSTLSWTGHNNMRYAVYAVPSGVNPGNNVSSDYLIGNPYETTFNVSGYTSGYKLGVSVVDRYGNEYAVVWLGDDSVIEQLPQVTITDPKDGATTEETFSFNWSAISGATYTLEISTSASFSSVAFSKTTTATTISSTAFNLAQGTTYYWRVKASKSGYASSTSWIGSFTTYKSSTGGSTTTSPKDPATYTSVNNFSIENLWFYAKSTSNFPSQLGGDQRSMTAYNGNVYITDRNGYLHEFSGTTGQYLRAITLSGDYATSSSGTALTYKCNDIFADGAGNLCISNMTTSTTSQPFTVCTVNLSTGATTRVFESSLTTAYRIDYAAALGDVTTTGGQIWAAVANSNIIYRWTRNAFGAWVANATTISTYYSNTINAASNNSTAPRIMPLNNDQFILDGHNSAPTLYTFITSGKATMDDSFASNSSLAPTADNWNGLCQATVKNNPIFAYVSSIAPNAFNVVSNPSNFEYQKMEKLWTIPDAGFGSESNSYVSSQPATISNSDGSATIFIYTPNNGLAAYKVTYSGGSVDIPVEDLNAVTLNSPTNGATTTKGFNFQWSAIEGASYTIELATSATFSDIKFSANTNTNSYSSTNFALADGTTYYWRVKASKSGYNSSTSSTASFKTATPNLSPVTLISPTAGTTPEDGFSFSWSSIVGATYTLEISTTSSFSNVLFSATTATTTYSSSNFDLDANTTYYWRVKAAVTGYNSSTSEARVFTTAKPTLSAVTLNSPIGGVVVGESFNFSWTSIESATFTLEISPLATFATVMYTKETTKTTLPSNDFQFTDNTQYYWRITASKNGYNNSVSKIESFRTPAPEVIDPIIPDTGLPTDGAEYDQKQGLIIENKWIYSKQTGNYPDTHLGRDQRGMAAYNGNIYISERNNGAGFLLEFNGQTGEYIRTIALTGDYLTLSDGNALGYPCNDVFVDGANNLCVSNMVTSVHSSGQLNVCTVDIETGATTRVFESYMSDRGMRLDHCMVYGDIKKAGAKIFAAASAGSSSSTYRRRVYCWTRTADHGSDDAYTYWPASSVTSYTTHSFYPSDASNFGNAPRVLPISSNQIIIDGSTVYPTLYSLGSSSISMLDSFSSNSSIKPSGMLSAGMCVTKVNDKPLYIYAFNDDIADFFNFAVVYNPNNFDYSSMELLWTIPKDGLGITSHGYVSAIPATLENEDKSITLFLYVPNNGIAAYRIYDPTVTSVEKIDETQGLAIKVYDKTVCFTETAQNVTVYNPAGAMVATGNDVKAIDLNHLATGVYIVNAENETGTTTQRIVLR